ncbi:hypothetical protein [uncultured Mucilaginibacter sp.]|uniref:hypothetical protein n=1 Tax=uncultured Mucilaginibacter sp. TaxID=797541 RepID=UPI0025FB95DE|nr:hypothetical protein [uncultured Mucilaginibacter sp.]
MKKLNYLLTLSILFMVIAVNTSWASTGKKQNEHWGTPYSIAYLAKHHKLIEANKAFNYTTVYFNIYLPPNTYFTYWTVTFDNGINTYTFNTDPYAHYNPPYYEDSWSGIPQGTYTVTIHNNGYGNGYLFDAVLDFVDANSQSQSPYFWDKNTDYSDFVFQNVYVPGDPNTSIGMSLSAHQ